MFLKSPAVPDFVALHEGSIVGEKTQPALELFPEEKYPWFGEVTCTWSPNKLSRRSLINMRSFQERYIAIAVGSSRLSWWDVDAETAIILVLANGLPFNPWL